LMCWCVNVLMTVLVMHQRCIDVLMLMCWWHLYWCADVLMC
jgi:hypothetical protein